MLIFDFEQNIIIMPSCLWCRNHYIYIQWFQRIQTVTPLVRRSHISPFLPTSLYCRLHCTPKRLSLDVTFRMVIKCNLELPCHIGTCFDDSGSLTCEGSRPLRYPFHTRATISCSSVGRRTRRVDECIIRERLGAQTRAKIGSVRVKDC